MTMFLLFWLVPAIANWFILRWATSGDTEDNDKLDFNMFALFLACIFVPGINSVAFFIIGCVFLTDQCERLSENTVLWNKVLRLFLLRKP